MSNVEPLVQPSSISDDQISSYVAYSAPTENDDIIFKQTTGNCSSFYIVRFVFFGCDWERALRGGGGGGSPLKFWKTRFRDNG